MSTLRAINLQHPSSGTVNAQLTSSGNLTGAGMDLISSQSFSAVSTVSVNNCFSSTYENYRIVLAATGTTGSTTPARFRMRVSGVDASGTDYYIAGYYDATGGSGRLYTSSQTSANMGDFADYIGAMTFDVYRPFSAVRTAYTSLSSAWGSVTASGVYANGLHSVAASYDGITIFPTSGTLSGTLRIYGYRNA